MGISHFISKDHRGTKKEFDITCFQQLTTCYLGMNSKTFGTALGRSHPFFGQMSSFFFFQVKKIHQKIVEVLQESLTQNEVKLLAEMPMKLFANYQPHSAGFVLLTVNNDNTFQVSN